MGVTAGIVVAVPAEVCGGGVSGGLMSRRGVCSSIPGHPE